MNKTTLASGTPVVYKGVRGTIKSSREMAELMYEIVLEDGRPGCAILRRSEFTVDAALEAKRSRVAERERDMFSAHCREEARRRVRPATRAEQERFEALDPEFYTMGADVIVIDGRRVGYEP